MEKISGNRCPYQSDNTLGDHSSIEDGAPMTFARHTACHQGTLCSMETRNGSTGNGNEHHRKNWSRFSLGVRVLHSIPDLRQGRKMYIKHHQNPYCHENKSHSKNRVNLADYLIYRQHGSKDIINEYNYNPESHIEGFGCQLSQESCRRSHKDSPHQHHQQHSKRTHDLLGSQTQITTNEFGQAFASVT